MGVCSEYACIDIKTSPYICVAAHAHTQSIHLQTYMHIYVYACIHVKLNKPAQNRYSTNECMNTHKETLLCAGQAAHMRTHVCDTLTGDSTIDINSNMSCLTFWSSSSRASWVVRWGTGGLFAGKSAASSLMLACDVCAANTT